MKLGLEPKLGLRRVQTLRVEAVCADSLHLTGEQRLDRGRIIINLRISVPAGALFVTWVSCVEDLERR